MFRGAHVNQVLLLVSKGPIVDYSYLNANLTSVLHLYFPLVPADCKLNAYSFRFCTILYLFIFTSAHIVLKSFFNNSITVVAIYTLTIFLSSLSGVNVDYLL